MIALTCDAFAEFVRALVAGGWSTTDDYKNTHCTTRFTRDGFVISCYPERLGKQPLVWDIACYGPDKLSVELCLPVSIAKLHAAMHVCDLCGCNTLTPTRYSFAGRACPECATAQPEPYSG